MFYLFKRLEDFMIAINRDKDASWPTNEIKHWTLEFLLKC
jgi:hypothetical protein